jgi:hypothetical protein
MPLSINVETTLGDRAKGGKAGNVTSFIWSRGYGGCAMLASPPANLNDWISKAPPLMGLDLKGSALDGA